VFDRPGRERRGRLEDVPDLADLVGRSAAGAGFGALWNYVSTAAAVW